MDGMYLSHYGNELGALNLIKHLVSGGFLGWKINSGFPDGEVQHSMIAQRVIPINYDLNR